jgi:photosystem II stability/assembly factor-like uncharacterized protein
MNNKHPLSARYPDLLAGKNDPALSELIEDLETLYTSHSLPARLARPEDNIPIDAQPASVPLPAQTGTLASSEPKRHGRWARLNALAAVVFTMLLVGALVTTFALARRNAGPASPGTNASAIPCQTKTNAAQFPLEDVHMMTASTGWAISWRVNGPDRFELVRTVDGGCHWKIVTPANHGSLFASHYAYISESAAWVELVDGKKITYARTTDGGANWQFALSSGSDFLASPGGSSVTFLTPERGWLLSEIFQGTKRTGIALYRTTNGGLSWQKLIQNTLPSTPGGSLPSTAFYTGLTFLNQSTGWITADAGGAPDILLYLTFDGGKSWEKQHLPLPQGISSLDGGTIVEPPQFFSDRDGMLPVLFWAPSGLCVYVTHDGGESWQSTAFLYTFENPGFDVSLPAPVPRFASMNFGWFWQGAQFRASHTLVVTHDGGQHWTATRVALPAPYVDATVDFLSEQIGWLMGQAGGSRNGSALFKTTDGGQTWRRVDYSVS